MEQRMTERTYTADEVDAMIARAVAASRPPAAQPAAVHVPVAWLKRHELADLQTCNHRRLGADSPRIWAPNAPDAPPPELDLVAVYIAAQPAPVQQTCNCRWDGEVQVQQCTLHEAHLLAVHEWAGRAKAAEAKLAAPDLQAEIDATNRQVEILSDALAESRREVAALAAPVACECNQGQVCHVCDPITPPAQEFVCSTGLCHYKALPDPIHHTDLSEHPEYISGWNDYRAAMMEMMK
jgi:hypothetical protein